MMAQSNEALVDLNIGHYELRKCLGAGGFGQVYEAWDKILGRSVALKFLTAPPGQCSRNQLVAEARLAASLQHLAFVKIFGIESDGQSPYIIMELVRGETLRVKGVPFTSDPAAVLDVVDQVAAAMIEAHAAHLVHGDIKPANLMRESSGTVRILDFGLARQVDPNATQSAMPEDPQGTIAYMAPERLAGRAPTPASDIYSLGVVLYELATGERPYCALHGLALASALMQGDSDRWQYPVGIDHGLLQLIFAMTARDLRHRTPSMAAVRARIARLRGNPGRNRERRLPALPVPWAARLRPGSPIRMLPAMMLLLTLALVADNTSPRSAPPMRHFSDSTAMNAGLQALKRSDRDGAIELALHNFDAVLRHVPGHAGALAGQSLAYSLLFIGDSRDETWLRRAAASANLALASNDQLALAHAAQSRVYSLSGRSQAALAEADRALTLDPGDLWALDVKINTLFRAQRYNEAHAVLGEAQSRMPRERGFSDLEGTMHYQQGDYTRAERAFRQSISLEPDGVFGYANLAATLLRKNRRDEALGVLQQGLRVQPSGVLYSNLGTVLFARGEYHQASVAFEHAVSASKGSPNDYLKWANLADALRWIPGREAASKMSYRRAMQLMRPMLTAAPNDATFLTRMGVYAARLDDQPDALSWVQRGVHAAPSNPDVHYRAALAYELRGHRNDALEHLARATALGYPFSLVESEPEFVALRRDSRYQTLAMSHAR